MFASRVSSKYLTGHRFIKVVTKIILPKWWWNWDRSWWQVTTRMMTDQHRQNLHIWLLWWLTQESGLKSAHRKGLPSANKLPSTGGLLHDNTSQKLTLHKFRTCLTLLFFYLSSPNYSIVFQILFTRQKQRGVESVESIESRDISNTKRPPHFCNVISYILFHAFFFVQPHTFPKILSFRFLCNLERRPFLRNFKTKREQTTLIF